MAELTERMINVEAKTYDHERRLAKLEVKMNIIAVSAFVAATSSIGTLIKLLLR